MFGDSLNVCGDLVGEVVVKCIVVLVVSEEPKVLTNQDVGLLLDDG